MPLPSLQNTRVISGSGSFPPTSAPAIREAALRKWIDLEAMDRLILAIFLFNPAIRLMDGYVSFLGDAFLIVASALMLFSLLLQRNDHTVWFAIIGAFACVLSSLVQISFLSEDVKFLYFILLSLFFATNAARTGLTWQMVNRLETPLRITLIFVTIFLFWQLTVPTAWYTMYDQPNFKANLYHPHNLAYLLLALFLLNGILNRRTPILMYVLHFVMVALCFVTGVRTIVIVLLGLMLLEFFNNRHYSLMVALCIAAVLAFSMSGIDPTDLMIFKKNQQSLRYSDISSGRFDFWAADLAYYFDGSVIQKLLGFGSGLTRVLHRKLFKLDIWSHNDLIHVLVSYGLLGFMLYISCLVAFLRKTCLPIAFSGVLVFLALANGLFPYAELVPMIPLMAVYHYRKKGEGMIP